MGLSVFDSPPLKEDIMKYKVTLNGKTYEIEVEAGKAMCLAEYEAYAPAAALQLPCQILKTPSTFKLVSLDRN